VGREEQGFVGGQETLWKESLLGKRESHIGNTKKGRPRLMRCVLQEEREWETWKKHNRVTDTGGGGETKKGKGQLDLKFTRPNSGGGGKDVTINLSCTANDTGAAWGGEKRVRGKKPSWPLLKVGEGGRRDHQSQKSVFQLPEVEQGKEGYKWLVLFGKHWSDKKIIKRCGGKGSECQHFHVKITGSHVAIGEPAWEKKTKVQQEGKGFFAHAAKPTLNASKESCWGGGEKGMPNQWNVRKWKHKRGGCMETIRSSLKWNGQQRGLLKKKKKKLKLNTKKNGVLKGGSEWKLWAGKGQA